MFTLEELNERSKVYFENNDKLQNIFATNDGNFFYPDSETDARNHERSNNNLVLFKIKKEDIIKEELIVEIEKKEESIKIEVEEEISLEEIRDFLKSNNIKFNARLGETKLRLLYNEHKND